MRVSCKQCLAAVDLPPGADPHATTWCGCCPRIHHHGAEAEACVPGESHDGPCWNPPVAGVRLELQPNSVAARPPGCGVCRPVVHYPVAGSAA
jgi:hypothetical protein